MVRYRIQAQDTGEIQTGDPKITPQRGGLRQVTTITTPTVHATSYELMMTMMMNTIYNKTVYFYDDTPNTHAH